MSSTNEQTVSRKMVLSCAMITMAILLVGASSAIITKAWAQTTSSSSTGDIKSKAKEVENTVISALKSYATAIGAKYIDLDLLANAPSASSNNTAVGGGAPTVVNQTAYSDAKNLISKAQDQLQAMAQSASPQQATTLAKAQGGIEALKTLIEGKAPFNLAEDIAQSPIVNNLHQVS